MGELKPEFERMMGGSEPRPRIRLIPELLFESPCWRSSCQWRKGLESRNFQGWEHHDPTRESIGLLIARIAVGAIFLWSGFGKLSSLSEFTAGMVERGIPLAQALAPLGAAIEFAAALALILGVWTRLAASALAVFTVVATLIAHRFWDFPAQEQRMQTIQFMKNLAMFGGLAALTATGGGRFSFDRILRG
jgi:putative oxidoreductase